MVFKNNGHNIVNFVVVYIERLECLDIFLINVIVVMQEEYINDKFALPYGYKGRRRIARKLNTQLVIGILFVVSILIACGILLYQYLFNKKIVFEYNVTSVYLVYVDKDKGADYSHLLQSDGYAGYEFDNMVIAKIFDNQTSAVMCLEEMINKYPLVAIKSINNESINLDLDSETQGDMIYSGCKYFYGLINKLNQYTTELKEHTTNSLSVQNRLKKINIQLLGIISDLKEFDDDVLQQFLSKVSNMQGQIATLVSNKITEHLLNQTICKTYL